LSPVHSAGLVCSSTQHTSHSPNSPEFVSVHTRLPHGRKLCGNLKLCPGPELQHVAVLTQPVS
jgi:hypothetical protein